MKCLTNTTIRAARIQARAGRVPGVAIVVVGPEGVRAKGAAGWADLKSHVPMATDIAIPWFSMTKVATATLAMRLAGEGIVDLDDPVAPVVEEVGLLQPAEWAERITPRNLIQHTAGLANPIPLRWIHPRSAAGPDQDAFLASMLTRNPRLRAEPGSQASYSNLGALVVAAWLERATGGAFETLMQRLILDTLRMTNTGFATPEAVRNATGYHRRASAMRLLLPRWVIGEGTGAWLSLQPFAVDGPAYGGLIGTPDDAARFLQMHVANGFVDATRIIPEEAAGAMRRIDRPGRQFDFGLGWFRPARDREAQPAFVQHLGGGAGFHCLMRIYPKARVGAVVMGNATAFDADAVAKLALDFQ